MGQPTIKWGAVARYFSRRGYVIYSDGGDKIIQAPATNDPGRTRQQVRIGHLGAIKRAFGVTAEQILKG